MSTYTLPAKALVDPVTTVPRVIGEQRWLLPLLLLVVTSIAAGVAFAARWDAGPDTISGLQRSGQLMGMTEQDIADKVQLAERTALVGGVASGLFLSPLLVLLVTVALKFAGWLCGTSGTFKALFTAASVGFLPLALKNAIVAVSLLRQPAVSADQAAKLLPSNLGAFVEVPAWATQAATQLDFFALWSVGLLGLGFSAATGMRKGRALALLVLLFVLYVGVVHVGLPGMGEK